MCLGLISRPAVAIVLELCGVICTVLVHNVKIVEHQASSHVVKPEIGLLKV